jgi:hypothetical protein
MTATPNNKQAGKQGGGNALQKNAAELFHVHAARVVGVEHLARLLHLAPRVGGVLVRQHLLLVACVVGVERPSNHAANNAQNVGCAVHMESIRCNKMRARSRAVVAAHDATHRR